MTLDALLRHVGSGGKVLARSNDLVLAVVVVAIITLMILPLPLPLIDGLVAGNICFGVMLMLMSIYVASPLQFSAFPSVLLITTLYRLALSVATTRMILLHGDGGNIIGTFGELVAGGNIVVGLVVFLIITLVQFLVIAKGAERVAEVGARFTLDAMPGKQMSIDSDLRSGLIDKAEARRKRDELELESKLHGSLDGAMKFVKGDAIAGIVIIIVNLLGGLAIGVFQLGMSAGDAMEKYSILTIGDGLVAQIPALLGAMSAGLIVTRVSDGNDDKHLGDSIQRQITSIPRVMMVTGAMCLALALVPGFPSTIFVGLGVVIGLLGAMLVPAFRHKVSEVSQPTFDTVLQRKAARQSHIVETREPAQSAVSSPLRIELPAPYAANGRDAALRARFEQRLQAHRESSGVPLPTLRFRWHARDDDRWSLDVFDVPVVRGHANDATDVESLVDGAMLALRRNVKLFLGLQECNTLLKDASASAPDTVKEVLRAIPMQGLSTILRNLVEEEVPIGNLKIMLEGLIQASQTDKDLHNLTEYARMALARQLCHAHAHDGTLRAISLTAALEEQLLQAIRAGGAAGSQLTLDPAHLAQLQQAVLAAIRVHRPDIIVAPVPLRRHLRQLLVDECFDTPVFSYPEVVAPFSLDLVHRVALDTTGPRLSVAG